MWRGGQTLRPPLEERLLRLAEYWSTWSTCFVKHGAVLAVGNRVIAQGYNGAPSGLPHCIDVGCDLHRGHCRRTIHAEDNCLRWAREVTGEATFPDATLYVTGSPCRDCQTLIAMAGIRRVVYRCVYGGVVPDLEGVEWIEWGWGGDDD